MTNRITNTTIEAERNPGAVLAIAAIVGPKNLPEWQEARGQDELIESLVLPTACAPDDRAALARAGVTFGAGVEGDPLFCAATLPEGWVLRATEHALWTELVDAAGHVRAKVFYKAAYYDRKAHLYAVTRYHVEMEYEGNPGGRDFRFRAVVRDAARGDAVLFTGPWTERGVDERPPALAWLAEHYPDWRDAAAYWGAP